MNDALFLHRIHFAFTITFHYLFPQLTMGLALLLVQGRRGHLVVWLSSSGVIHQPGLSPQCAYTSGGMLT